VGSAFDRSRNPAVDLDHQATARHAATAFGRAGHRRIAIIVPDSQLAGDRDSVAGFALGAAEYDPAPLQVDTIRHDGTPEAVFRAIDRLIRFVPRVTGIYSAGGVQTVAVMTRLLQLGVHIPGEVSVVSRDDEPALDFVTPAPARYFRPPIKFARALFRQIRRQLAPVMAPPTTIYILPDFLRKGTMAARPEMASASRKARP
jgi:LacI family transcriptional regulator